MKNQPVTLMALIGILIAPCQKNTQLTPQQTIAEVSSFKTRNQLKTWFLIINIWIWI